MEKLLLVLGLILPLSVSADSVVPIDKVEQSVNVRMSPDAASEIVGKLEQGSSAEIVSSTDSWHEIKLEGGSTGFISADWTRVIADEPVEIAVVDAAEEISVEDIEEAAESVVVETMQEAVESVSGDATLAEQVPVEETPLEDTPTVEAPAEAESEASSDVAVTAVDETTEETVVEGAAETAPVPAETTPVPAVRPGIKLKGKKDYLVKFRDTSHGGTSQVYDDGNRVGIGTTSPKQRLEVNGNIQIHEQNSSVAGLMITQSTGETGYIMHNRASTLTIGAGSEDRITIDRDGNVGIAVNRPEHPLEMASGAHVTAGGVFTNSSSRAKKENIVALNATDASTALMALEPVVFNYRNERNEDYVGFIAEDVPELVAVTDRDALSTMDIVAVLTRVVQEQQNKIKELEVRLDAL